MDYTADNRLLMIRGYHILTSQIREPLTGVLVKMTRITCIVTVAQKARAADFAIFGTASPPHGCRCHAAHVQLRHRPVHRPRHPRLHRHAYYTACSMSQCVQ